MDQDVVKHLEFIQNIITRMGANSFHVKGWSITITSALLALFVNSSNKYLLVTAIFPIILFWCLDTYYLQQERKFRGLYNDILKNERNIIKKFAMITEKYKDGNYDYILVAWSKTIWPIYLTEILILFLFGLFYIYGGY